MAAKKRAGVGSGSTRVVYVHGIGAHPPSAELKRMWDIASFGRDMGTDTVMTYWSDILHPRPEGRSRGGTPRSLSRDRSLDVERLLAEAGVEPDRPDAQALAQGLVRALGGSEASAGPAKKILPEPFRRPIARAFLESFVKDTAAYFFRPAARRQIRARLRDTLRRATGPITLVTHSQGTIIAYEVLHELAASGHRVPLARLVTMGSPLGIREIQDLLEPAGSQLPALRVPIGVEAWSNFADPLDLVALDKALANDVDRASVVRDELISTVDLRRLSGFDPHSAVGYLAHPKVRAVVHRATGYDPRARFLVARDVAAELVADSRTAVLVEVLEPGHDALGAGRARGLNEGSGSSRALAERVQEAVTAIDAIVVGDATGAAAERLRGQARVDPLRRFVGAHLTPSEVATIAERHEALHVYAVWKSSRKRKLIHRSDAVIHVDAARSSYGAFGKGIRWAVLDTGIQADHPHFAGRIEKVWDCTRRGAPREVKQGTDRDGHGTHVAGIIAGKTQRASGESVAGMASEAMLVVYKVLNDEGEGEDAWIIKALDHIASQNENASELYIHGLNLSLGSPFDATVYGCGFSPVCAELRRLWRSGVLVVVASGNEGVVEVSTPSGEIELNAALSIGDPANLEDCIAVGSVHSDRPHLYGISSFSSRGPTADGRLKPDVVAPGERIASCNAAYRKADRGTWYRTDSGTSMAAPHVSGMLAAFLSVRRELRGRPDEVKELLLRTATDIGRDRYHQGHGIPNLMRMLLEA